MLAARYYSPYMR